MTMQQWKQYGYEVVLDNGLVYLVRAPLGIGYVIAEENGQWIRHQNINRAPWRFVDLRNHPRVLNLARQMMTKKCA
jgi:hypothetical protein